MTTVKMVSGPRHATDTATQAAAVTTTPGSITVQWKHYLQQLYLELSRYLEIDKLDIRCKNPALHYTVLAALTGSSVRCWADPTIIWLGIQNILICDTISSSQQSAGEGWCTGCRYRVSTLHCTGWTGLENMSWCQYPVSPQRGCSMHDSYTRTTLPTQSCFYTTLAQNCEILNRILNSIL